MASNRELKKKINELFSRNVNNILRESSITEFTGCCDLPMLNFIKITTTGDISKWLGKCIEPEKLWETIHSEYATLSGDSTNTQGLVLAKQITVLTNRINITNSIVYYLSLRGRVDELVQELINMGYRLTYTDLAADLERTISLSKSDHVKLTAAKHAYDQLDKGEKTSELDWYRMLSALAKHRQIVSINPALITVIEYCAMQKEFKEYCDMMNKATRK